MNKEIRKLLVEILRDLENANYLCSRIPSGQDRSFIVRGIAKRNLCISCRRICSLYMILPKDRDMKFGIEGRF